MSLEMSVTFLEGCSAFFAADCFWIIYDFLGVCIVNLDLVSFVA